MRIPRFLLREKMIVEDWVGSGARGPVFHVRDKPIRCSVQSTTRYVVDPDQTGASLTVNTLIMIRPEDGPVRPESRVTVRGRVCRVLEAYPMPDERRPSFWQLGIDIYSGSPAAAVSGSGGGS